MIAHLDEVKTKENSVSILKAMQWRYATKKFDINKRLGQPIIDDLIETVNLAPSSFGLQPFRILNIVDPAIRAQIEDATVNPAQVASASHLLVFAATTQLSAATVSELIDRTAEIRGLNRESLAARESQIAGFVERMDNEARLSWAQRQAYLALGVLVAAAAKSGIDACPMEGFDAPAVDRILGLKEQGLRSTVFAVLGHRAVDDPYAILPKVRKSVEQLVTTV